MNDPGVIYPVLALITWTFVMWFWMYATRIPAMQRAEVDVDELSRTGAALELPPEVARVADNYNHLHEQPVLFYALTLSIAILDLTNAWLVGLAWGYVGARVISLARSGHRQSDNATFQCVCGGQRPAARAVGQRSVPVHGWLTIAANTQR